jgi:hypothetical protein
VSGTSYHRREGGGAGGKPTREGFDIDFVNTMLSVAKAARKNRNVRKKPMK